MSLDQQFNTINDKLQQLLKQFGRLQKENERLKEELHAARQKERDSLFQADELQQQIGILKLAAGELNDKDKRDFEKKVNVYIREIDKCISFLSQ